MGAAGSKLGHQSPTVFQSRNNLPWMLGCRVWSIVTLAAGASAEMELRKARAGGVRGRAGCEGCRVSHLAAQTLGSEEAGVLGPARPGSTRHKATLWEEAGPWHRASPTPPAPQEHGWSPRRNVAWNLSKCGRMAGSGVWKPDGGEGQSAFLPLLPTPFC